MKITKKLYLFEGGHGEHMVVLSDVTGKKCFEDCFLLTTKEVTFDVPDDIAARKIAALDREIEKVTDQFGVALKRLKDEKAKLLCIENGVPA